MSVRKQLDRLLGEPVVADFGYPADQAMIARIVRGLQLLADELDAIAKRIDEGSDALVVPQGGTEGRPVSASSAEPSLQPGPTTESRRNSVMEQVGRGSPISLE